MRKCFLFYKYNIFASRNSSIIERISLVWLLLPAALDAIKSCNLSTS